MAERQQSTIKHSPYLRIPPQSIEAEMALLGSIMLRPDVMYEIIDFVRHESFYSEKHRIIYRNMFELFGKATPIDLLSLSSTLRDRDLLEQVGGATYLTELVNGVPSAANAKYYAEIVQKKHLMRKLIECSEEITGLGYDESGELDEILDSAEKKLFEVTNFSSAHRFIELKDTIGEVWDRLEKLHNSKDEMRGIPTGFKELDIKLAGFQKSDLIILAARPSVGKTSLALDIARQAAVLHNVPVGIFSLEMSSQQLVDRMLAAESRVDSWKLRTGKQIQESDFEAMRSAIDRLAKAPIFIDDQPANNILKMRSVARRLKE
jgi:replicative DNA helicase